MRQRKFLFGIFSLIFTQSVFSQELNNYQKGFYLGGQIGLARTYEGSGPKDYINRFVGDKHIQQGGIGGRLFIGYEVSPYFSLEVGDTYYPRNIYKASNQQIKISSRKVIDLSGKFILPLGSPSSKQGWQLFAKLGVAIGRSKKINHDGSDIRFKPAYGLGVGYSFANNFNIDFSWLGIYSKDKLNANEVAKFSSEKVFIGMPSANFLGFGVSYKF